MSKRTRSATQAPPARKAAPAATRLEGGITAQQMSLVLDVSRMLSVTADLDLLLHAIAQAVTALLDCERASIFLHDDKHHEMWTKVALGSPEIRIPDGAGIVGHVFGTCQPVHVPKPYDDPRFNREPDRRSGFVTRNLMAAPMLDINQAPVGVVQAINKVGGPGQKPDEGAFSDNELAMLQLLADQAGVAIQRYRLQQAALESLALRHEMELARGVQEAMIPHTMPDVPGLDAAGWTRPASINGGDVFDLWRTPDGRLGVLLADASGHGIGPAMVACQVRTLVRALSESEGHRADPYRLLSLVNARLYEDLPAGQFITAFLGFIEADGKMAWCSGGHGIVLTRDAKGRGAEYLEATLPPLGVIPQLPHDRPADVRLAPEASLVVASDGITEAMSPTGELFGEPRLARTVEADGAAPDRAIGSVRAAVRQWQGKEEPLDDQTVVVVVRK